MRYQFLFALAITAALASCTKPESDPPPPDGTLPKGKVTMTIVNKVGSLPIERNSTIYHNPNGDEFKVTKFKYFISDIKLNNADGGQYVQAGSKYLIEEYDPGGYGINLKNVPDGTYKSVTFRIGVDSTYGQPLPNDDMVFASGDGFMAVNMEGIAAVSTQPNQAVIFHIGGYDGPNGALRIVTLDFPGELVVAENSHNVHVTADLLKMFAAPYLVDFRTLSAIHAPGENGRMIADNYKNMFSVTSVGQ